MCHTFFIRLSVDGRLDCFLVLPIVNSAAMNTGVYVSFWITFLSRYIPRSGIAGSFGMWKFNKHMLNGWAVWLDWAGLEC